MPADETPADDLLLERALGRIRKAMVGLGAGGAIAAWAWRGWTWAAGFALGALFSWVTFRWFHHVVEALGGGKARPRVAVMLGLRYLLLGGAAYVIVRFSKISLLALLA